MAGLVTREEALALVLGRVRHLAREEVPLEQAAGRITAEPARAEVDLPPFPSSAMDGFALRAEDTPGRLPVVARIPAGRPAERMLSAGEAMAISTGGVVPEGADAVVPVEYVVEHDNELEVPDPVAAAANVRPRGGDVAAGATVVEAGVRLGPAHVGALGAAGVARVSCGARPRAVVLATGSELRPPGEPLAPGQVYEANSVALLAALASSGALTTRLAAVADDEPALRGALERALEADVVVTTGGVSVGPHDLVRRTLTKLGVEEVFWGVAVKPGKPVAFGVRGSTLVFGLPGNPVSSLVGYELFVRPAVLALQGAAEPGPAYERGRLARAVRRNGGRDELLRARLAVGPEGPVLDPIVGQESHMIARAAGADAFVLVPQGQGEAEAGSAVDFLRLAAA